MVNTIDRDRKPAQNCRKFAQGINLFDSGNVRKALCCSRNGVCSIKANIRPNQKVTSFYCTQFNFGPSLSASCNCKAGQSLRCSPVCILLMKVIEATNKAITGSLCTHKPCTWNAATEKNVKTWDHGRCVQPSCKSTLPLQFPTRKEMEKNF